MEHKSDVVDFNYLRHAGWHEDNASVKEIFSKSTRDLISKKVSELTRGVDPQNRKIVVRDDIIAYVVDGVFSSLQRPTGDIFSRFNIPSTQNEDLVSMVISQSIETIVSNIRGNFSMNESNQKLSIWNSVYGSFNSQNLRAHPPLKIRENRPSTMQFFSNY